MDTHGKNDTSYYLPNENDLGYKFYPRQYPNAPGYPRLDIVLRRTPTLQHYDPETLFVRVVSDNRGIERHIIHHPWQSQQVHFKVVAGRIIWQDRVHKTQEAFTFGAQLEIKSLEDKTICSLTSTAPIIPLGDELLSIPTLLALEVETLIAVRRAVWVHNHAGYIQRLAKVEPHDLYQASLKAILEKLESFDQDAVTEPICGLLRFIHHEPTIHELDSHSTLQGVL
ncbi:MAG: hypothetical protein JXA42_25415 [Anaerolineales bacterium]|nr:hypothetical protein [Anaerolineales bacterium]